MSTWIEGTATRSTFRDWYGIGATREHAEPWSAQSDHPTLGHGHGATPHEYVLHALAACLTLDIATTAAARKIELTKIESIVEGDIDVRGILGVAPDVRNGFTEIRASFTVEGDADDDRARRARRSFTPALGHVRDAGEPDSGPRLSYDLKDPHSPRRSRSWGRAVVAALRDLCEPWPKFAGGVPGA